MATANRKFNVVVGIVLVALLAGIGWKAYGRYAAKAASIRQQAFDEQKAAAERAAARKVHVPQRLTVEEGMSVQGPIVVDTGADGGEGANVWNTPTEVSSTSSAATADSAAMVGGGTTNSLKCQFNTGDFTVPSADVVTQIQIAFQAWQSSDMSDLGTVIHSVKTSLTGATDVGDDASLTNTDAGYVYTITGLAISDTDINGAWEIDLIFVASGPNQYQAHVYKVEATVTYGAEAVVVPRKSARKKKMGQFLKQSSTAQSLKFQMISSTDHVTAVTGLSPTVTLRKEGGSFASPSGSVTEIADGWYEVAGNATDTNTLGGLILHATGTGADPWDDVFEVVKFDPQDSVRLGLTALPNAAAEGAGGLFTRGTGAGQINQDANGRIDSNLVAIKGTASAGTAGYAGIDWSHINAPTTTVDLSGTTISTSSYPTNFASLSITSGGDVSLGRILGTDVTETSAGYLADGFTKFYDVATPTSTMNLISGVTLVTTLTTYTGNTVQTGDSYARLGTPANASIAADLAEIEAETDGIASIPTSNPSVASIVNGVWDAVIASHVTAGSMGKKLSDAASSGDPWATDLPGTYTAGQAGYIVGTNLDAAVSGISPPTAAAIATAIFTDLTSSSDFSTASSIGKLLKDNINATISSRGTFSGGAVDSVTGDVGGNVNGHVASVVGAVGSVTGNVGGNVTGSVGSVAGNVTGSVGSVAGAVASVTAGVTLADGAIATAKIADGAITEAKLTVPTEPSGAASGIFSMIYQVWGFLIGRKTTLTSTQLKLYKSDGSTVAATMTVSDDTVTQTRGAGS